MSLLEELSIFMTEKETQIRPLRAFDNKKQSYKK